MLLCLKGQRLLTPSQAVIYFITFIFLSGRAGKKQGHDKSYSAIKLSIYCGSAMGRGTAPGPKGEQSLCGISWGKIESKPL